MPQVALLILMTTVACLATERAPRYNPCAQYAGGVCPSSDKEEASSLAELAGEIQQLQGRIKELQTQLSHLTSLQPSLAQSLQEKLTAAATEANSLLTQLNSTSGSTADLEEIKNSISILANTVNQLRLQIQAQEKTDNTDNPGDIGNTDSPGDIGDTDNPGDIGDTDNPGDIGDTDSPGDIGDSGELQPYVYFADSNGYRVGFFLQPWHTAYQTDMTAKITYGDFTFAVDANNSIVLQLPVTLHYTLHGEEYCWHAVLNEAQLSIRLNSDDFTADSVGNKTIKSTSLSKLQAMQPNTGGCL